MSIDEQRRAALEELRDLLAHGVEPTEAVKTAALSAGLRPDILERTNEQSIAEKGKIARERRLADQRYRAKKLTESYDDIFFTHNRSYHCSVASMTMSHRERSA